MIALVHHDAVKCAAPTLKSLGYTVLIWGTPLETKSIDGEYLRHKLQNDGRYGVKEFTKLLAYTLVDYPVVVLLDLDVLVMKQMDNLGVQVGFDNPIKSSHYDSSKGINSFFTRDYNIADNTMTHVAAQRGLLVIEPSLLAYDNFLSIIRHGDYRKGARWTGLGYGESPGSTTFQELIPYYYDHFHPGTGIELNRCVYNNIADSPRENNDGSGSCKDGHNRSGKIDKCEDCRSCPIDEVSKKNDHTVCKNL